MVCRAADSPHACVRVAGLQTLTRLVVCFADIVDPDDHNNSEVFKNDIFNVHVKLCG